MTCRPVGDGADAIILFGSVARGEANDHSDIDLAVIAQPGWEGAPTWRMR